MENLEIKVINQLSEDQKKQVARMYYNAFVPKFTTLWMFSANVEEAEKVLERSIEYNSGFYAIDENDDVLGFVGVENGEQYFTSLSYRAFRAAYSVFGSLWRSAAYRIYRMFHGGNGRKVLHIDPIVVSEKATGRGIGSKLLDVVLSEAKKIGLPKVILEVVDTNQKAKKLYERLGFRVYKTENLGVLTESAGFSKVYCMELPV